VVVPIFAGYDFLTRSGRIFKYDVTGGRYEEQLFYATGSGGKEARSTLRKLFTADMARDAAVQLAVEALIDAADIDVATSGPDVVRGIYPVVKVVSQYGTTTVSDDQLRSLSEQLLQKLKG
jgi:proteasome beta subunit